MYVPVYTLLVTLYVTHRLSPAFIPEQLVGTVAIIALLVSARRAYGLYRLTGLFFLISGALVFIFLDLPSYLLLLKFDSMLGLLSLFFMLPFIDTLIRIGRFDKSMSRLLYLDVQQLPRLYRRSSFVTHLLGIFLNIATIPLLKKSLAPSMAPLPVQVQYRFYAKNLLRAYALCLTWSPLEVMVSTSIDALGLKYHQIFVGMFLLAILFIGMDWIIFSHGKDRSFKLHSFTQAPGGSSKVHKNIVKLIGFLFLFVITVNVVDHGTGEGFLFSVVLTILPFSLISSVLLRKTKQYLQIALPSWKSQTGKLANYFFMFLSAGFFVETLSKTPWLMMLQKYLSAYADQTLLMYLFVGGYFVVTSLTGFHPLVSLALLLSIIHPFIEELASVSFAFVMIGSSLATVMYSPFNVSVSVLSNQLHIQPFRIMIQNIAFALVYILVTILTAYLIHWLSLR